MIILSKLLALAGLAAVSCGMHEDPTKLLPSDSPVYISEYMCAERWVELHNPADTVVNLSGYILVAGGKEHQCEVAELQPNAYILLSNLQEMDEDDPIYLKDGEGALVDLIDSPKHKKNKSTTRRPLADGSFYQENTEIWTPGYSNDAEGHRAYQASRRAGNTTGVVISEIMADNESAYTDQDGNLVDFVELYNSSDKTVDLTDWGLSDNENYPHLYRFPEGTKIKAGKYLVVNCAKDVDGCAPFNIRNGSDCIYLCNKEGKIMAEVGPVGMLEDQSMAFSPDGKSFITTFNISPGYPNSAEGSALFFRKAQPASLPYVGIWEALPGEEGKPGWVEIRNNSNKEVDLKGFTITDDSPGEHIYTFPEKRLAPGAILLVNAGTEAGFEFRKSAALLLHSAKGDLLDQVTLGDIPAGMSRGREDGPAWVFFATPTPGTANGTGVHGRMMAPIASIPSGQYDDVQSISVELLGDGTIYYTSDGSTPTTKSKKYTGPIKLDKTTVIRAIAAGEDALSSPVSTWNYLVNEHHTLDVFCWTSDPDGIFSSASGIYAAGISLEGQEYPYKRANFWRGWVRQSNITLMPKQGTGFSAECGATIFGGWTRAYPKRSIKFKFKREYGAGKLHYKLYDTRDFSSFQGIVMRCGGQDTFVSMMRDDLTSDIVDRAPGMDLDVMATRPVVTYINAQYWGIYYIREKINKHFIASHYGIPTDGIDIIMAYCNCEEGSSKDWNEFYNFAKTKDLSKPENYQWMQEHMDLQNYADWVIAECYVGNRDAGNVRAFKSKHLDNKWRWILYDTDMAWTTTGDDGLFRYLTPQEKGIWSTTIIRALLKNDEFRALFLDRLEYQMHNVWNKENVHAAIDKLSGQIDGEVARNNARWKNTYAFWKDHLRGLHRFADTRQDYMKKQFSTHPYLRELLHMSKSELDRCFE